MMIMLIELRNVDVRQLYDTASINCQSWSSKLTRRAYLVFQCLTTVFTIFDSPDNEPVQIQCGRTISDSPDNEPL